MKQYEARITFPENPEAMDLVNVIDESDIIMAAPDEFFLGEIVSEGDIYLERHSYVYDDGVSSGQFAFRV